MMTTKSDTVRCFVAIEIPRPIQKLLKHVQTHLESEIRKASWTKLGNFHLTLKFLGDVQPQTINGVSEVIQNVADAQAPFSIELGKIGGFPNLNRSRVLWVGVKHGASTLSGLAKAVNLELKHRGFPIDSRFHPHFTLARFRAPMDLEPLGNILRQYDTIDGALVSVNEIRLMQSELRPSGAIYRPLNVFHFSA